MTRYTKTTNTARLAGRKKLAESVLALTFHEPHIARLGKPGQFVQLLTGRGIEPFFRRPMSIFATDPDKRTFTIILAVIGEGTKCLARLAVGDEISIVGPLGNSFTFPPRCRHAVLIAGGVGLPPLDFWARHLRRSRKNPPLVIELIGSRSVAHRIVTPGVRGVRRYYATDDGSFGYHGTVVDLLRELHANSPWPVADTVLYGCGPTPMLRALQDWLFQQDYRGQLSLEEMMPCGFGVCSGCVVPARPEREGYDRFVRVCQNGPVFDAREVSL